MLIILIIVIVGPIVKPLQGVIKKENGNYSESMSWLPHVREVAIKSGNEFICRHNGYCSIFYANLLRVRYICPDILLPIKMEQMIVIIHEKYQCFNVFTLRRFWPN
jgi:hypothetical protein